jgi:cytochrome c553
MKKTAAIPGLILLLILSLGAQTPPPAGEDRLGWAFPVVAKVLPPRQEGERTIPGTSKTYTTAQIDDLLNPPDWFPDEDAPRPASVMKGKGVVFACGACHLMSGHGHPESADLRGLTATYIMEQMADYKSGKRKDAAARMNAIAQGLSDADTRESAEWFAGLKPAPWTRVVEAAMVPKSYVGPGRMRFPLPQGGREPIGNRIITLPEDPARAASRDPHSGFVAYVPPGSIAKGKALVAGGNGKTVACSICHGDAFEGLANVPGLAGMHPIYMFRQLYIFKNGDRNGLGAQLMKKAVANLTEDDMLNISAFLASQGPK